MSKDVTASISSLAALGSQDIGNIATVEGNTIIFTVRATYGAAAINPLRLEIYYSPDGVNFDTIPFTFDDLDLDGLDQTSGSTFQKSFMVECPRDGTIKAKVRNTDALTAVTGIQIWNNIAMRRINIHLKIDSNGNIIEQDIL